MKVHFMGIGGSGASGIAQIAKAFGFEISGCDLELHNEFTIDLSQDKLFTGHSKKHLDSIDILALSPAILKFDPENEEVLEAYKNGVEVLTWQEFMGKYLEEDKFVIAVCGTHGKSTTTAMIGQMLEDAGLDPTVELGAINPKWGRNYRIGKSKYFVTEADEYNDNFLVSHPNITVITNIEEDHLDYFKNLQGVKNSFEKFLLQTKDSVVANISDPEVGDVIRWVMKESRVEVLDYSKSEFDLNLKVMGKHNLMNAKACFQVGLLLGIDPKVIIKSLNNFSGIDRRLELIGKVKGAFIYSDFGHHPTEIRVTVEALSDKFSLTTRGWKAEEKLWFVFQPHLFSRTKFLFDDFVKAFKEMKIAGGLILPIYKSREKDPGDINSKMLVEAIGRPKIEYMEKIEDLYEDLDKTLTPDDVILFLGAGDSDKWAKEYVERVMSAE